MEPTWTATELYEQLKAWEAALINAGKMQSTVNSYLNRATRFVKWLDESSLKECEPSSVR
jgi:hypothetical protein